MSRVTSLIILCSDKDKGIQQINKYPHSEGHIFSVVSIHDSVLIPDGASDYYKWYGGGKAIGNEVLIGAINWLEIDLLVVYLRHIDWDYPERVQVLYSNDDTEGLYELIKLF